MKSLRQVFIEDMQVRNLSPLTQKAYVQQVSLFARHFNTSPIELGPQEIRSYQIYLTNEKKSAPSSITVAVSALRFLYGTTLHKNWRLDEVLPSPQKPDTLPVVLSPEEVLHFLGCVEHIKHRTILTTCYAAGLRIGEAVSLKPNHIDSQPPCGDHNTTDKSRASYKLAGQVYPGRTARTISAKSRTPRLHTLRTPASPAPQTRARSAHAAAGAPETF